MKFFTVGTEALELDASQNAIFTGNVGIGTTLNLGRELLVKGEIAALDNTGTNDNQILMAVNNTIGNLAVTYGSTGSYVPFQLETSGTPRFTVSTAGAIKFNAYDSTNNTGTPTYMLGTDGSGNVVKVLGGDIPGGGGTVTGTGTATRVAFWSASDTITSDADLYWDNTNKRLGIGVSSPAALLEINGTGDAIRVESTNTGAGGAQIDLLHYSTSPADNDTMAYINMGGYYNTTPSQAYFSSIRTVATDISARQGELTFWTVNSTLQQRMVIDTDGNVGIGTTDPTTRLYVDGGESTFNRGNSAGTIATFRGQNAAKAVIGTATSYFTGNVGIGTTSPDTNLEIGAATNVAPKLRLTLNDSGNSIVAGQEYGGIQWKGNDGQGDGVRADIRVFGEGSSGETYMAFGTMTSGTSASTNAVERMRIDSSGNVGIGLTPNASYSKLQVKAPASSYGFDLVGRDAGSNGESQITFWNSNQATQLAAICNISDNLIFYTSTAERMRITSAGDVQIVGNRYLYANPSAGSTTIGAGFQLDAVNNIMKLWTNNTERMRITSGGNVGIGTTLPGTALAFGGLGSIWVNNDTTNPFGMDTVGGELRLFVGTGSASYQMKFGKYNGTTFTPHMTIGDDGSNPSYVGIGTTSPDAILETSKEVDGNQVGALLTNTRQAGTADSVSLNFGLGRTVDGFIFNIPAIKFLKEQQWTGTGSTVDGSLVFSTIQNETVAERMRITSAGNVGIGTTTPLAKLDIQGTQGQLFSVTDDLSGSIFAVSDISGVPIFDVNSSGVSYFDGNVGIGVTGPTAKLDVLGPDASTGTIKWQNGGSRRAGYLYSDSGGVAIYDTALSEAGIYIMSNLRIDFRVNGGEKMRIDSSGNVGIGVTNPGNKLSVGGSVRVNSSGNGQIFFGSGNLNIIELDGTDMKLSSGGLVPTITMSNQGLIKFGAYALSGAGTPTKLLGVDNSGNVLTTVSGGDLPGGPYLPLSAGSSYPLTGRLYAQDDIYISGSHVIKNINNNLFLDSASGYNVIIRPQATEAMRITSTGNVGIGTTSPTFKLHVNSTDASDNVAYIHHNNAAQSSGDVLKVRSDAGDNAGSALLNVANNTGSALYVRGDRNVGINNSAPNEKLSVRGNIELVGEGVGNCGVRYIKYNCPDEASYNVLGLTTSTANFITKVGINKTSPAVKLDVSDSIAGSGFTNGLARFENTIETSIGGAGVLNVANNYQGGFGTLIKFWFEESSVASINFNSSTNAVVYNTTSDYRLKEDLQQFDGLEIVDQIKTYNYKWKKADARGYGALAHELQEVFPDAVTGEKDGEDMQGVDYSTLVPVLIKSIQELKAEIELLKQQINN